MKDAVDSTKVSFKFFLKEHIKIVAKKFGHCLLIGADTTKSRPPHFPYHDLKEADTIIPMIMVLPSCLLTG